MLSRMPLQYHTRFQRTTKECTVDNVSHTWVRILHSFLATCLGTQNVLYWEELPRWDGEQDIGRRTGQILQG